MKRLVLLFVFAAGLVLGQTAHSVTLSWTPPSDAQPTTTYNILRFVGLCSSSNPVFTKINTALIAAPPYVDTNVTPGSYCYVATAVTGGAESAYSNTAAAPVPSLKPGGLTAIVQ